MIINRLSQSREDAENEQDRDLQKRIHAAAGAGDAARLHGHG